MTTTPASSIPVATVAATLRCGRGHVYDLIARKLLAEANVLGPKRITAASLAKFQKTPEAALLLARDEVRKAARS